MPIPREAASDAACCSSVALLNAWSLAAASSAFLACLGCEGGVPERGAAPDGGSLATGGALSCAADKGRVPESLKHCLTDADCTRLTFPTCCGANNVLGVSQGHTCTPAPVNCSLLPCPEIAYDSAEDGHDTSTGGIEVECQKTGDGASGLCRTHVVLHTGEFVCGASLCSDTWQACVHQSLSRSRCFPQIPGRECPPGTSMQPTCAGQPRGGCAEPPLPQVECTPLLFDTAPGAAPECQDDFSCSCLDRPRLAGYVCSGGEICHHTVGRDVYCVPAAQ